MTVVIAAAVFSALLLFYSGYLLVIDLVQSRRRRTRGRLDQDRRRQTERIPSTVHVFDVLDEVEESATSVEPVYPVSWWQPIVAGLGHAGIRISARRMIPAWAGVSIATGVLATWLTGDVAMAGIVANSLALLPALGLLFVLGGRIVGRCPQLPSAVRRMLQFVCGGQAVGPALPAVVDETRHGPRSLGTLRAHLSECTEVELSSGDHLVRGVPSPALPDSSTDVARGFACRTVPVERTKVRKLVARLAEDGTLVSIRRVRSTSLVVDDLLRAGVLTSEMMIFLVKCIRARVNILICGSQGSGKRTLLNVLSHFIPPSERVAVIERGDELRLAPLNVVRMEARPCLLEDPNEAMLRKLVQNCVSAEPERIIITDCGGVEMRDLFAALQTSGRGSITTLDARSPREAVARLETLVVRADGRLPDLEIRRQIAASIGLIVQMSRLSGGVHRLTRITEITGMEDDAVALHNIFEFVQTGLDDQRVSKGYFRTTGRQPSCLGRLDECGVGLSSDLFEPRQLEPLTLGGGEVLC